MIELRLRYVARIFTAVLIVIEAVPHGLTGQTVHTLDDCIRIALQNHPDAKIARMRVESAESATRGSLSNILPTVNYSAGYLNQGSYVNPQINYLVGKSEFHSAGLSFGQTLFDYGKWNQIAVAKNAYRYGKELEIQTRVDLILRVKEAFYQYLKDLQLLDVAQQSLKLAEQQMELVRHQYELEAVARSDLLKQQVQVGNMEVEVLNQQAVVVNSFNQLANVMGLDMGTDFSVVDPPGGLSLPVEPFNVLWQKVERANPGLVTKETQIQNAVLNLKIARANYFPSLSVFMGYDGSAPVFDELYSDVDKHWRLQTRLSLSLPLFTGFAQSSRIEIADVDRRIQEEEYRMTLRDLKVKLDFVVRQLENLQKVIPIFEETKISAEEDLRLAQERYNLGAATILDVLDAQLSVARANSSLVRATYDEKILRAQLDGLLGKM